MDAISRILKDKKVVLFDFDGTLVDSMGMWGEVDKAILRLHGLPIPDNFTEEFMFPMIPLTGDETAQFFLDYGCKLRCVRACASGQFVCGRKSGRDAAAGWVFLPDWRHVRHRAAEDGQHLVLRAAAYCVRYRRYHPVSWRRLALGRGDCDRDRGAWRSGCRVYGDFAFAHKARGYCIFVSGKANECRE